MSKLYRTALEIDPNYVPARYNLASASERLGRLDQAIAEYRRVLEIRPKHAGARRALEAALNGNGGS